MRIVLAGIAGRHPYGGVSWCSLMYLLGLRDLGHDVWYVEDTGECGFDPVVNGLARDPAYALSNITATLHPHGFADRWSYVDYTGTHHGLSESRVTEVCRSADVFLNLSGGSSFWREHYAQIPYRAFIDTDPAFTQLVIAAGPPWRHEFFTGFTHLFTFGSNIGTEACPVPTGGLRWMHTWQPVHLPSWPVQTAPPARGLSTVMTWRIDSFPGIGGNKDVEWAEVVDLPSRTGTPMELALTGPAEMLASHGWRCRPALEVSSTPDAYRRYIQGSLGEFSVAKHTYVRTNSGWFSDRTECYLASGRPAIVQDTGFSAHLPVGEGLMAFSSPDEAVAAVSGAPGADYPRHCAAARAVAESCFASDVVLPALLERMTAGRPRSSGSRS